MKIMKILLLFIVFFVATNTVVLALNVDELLLDRLVEKGVVTSDEAAGLRAEAAIKTQEEAELKTSFGINGATKINFGGYLQTLYTIDESAGVADSLKIRRARLDFRGNPTKNVGWRLQLDAVQPLSTVVTSITQNGSKDVTSKTTKVVNRPVILDAYIDYALFDYTNFRIGQFFIPFSRENVESNTKLDTINRSQVTEKLVPGRDIGSQGRDVGVQFSGDLDFGQGDKLADYSFGLFNGNGINVDDDNESKDIAGRLVFYPIQGLSFGVSQYTGRYGTTEAVKLRTGAEITYVTPLYSIKSEYVTGKDGAIEKYGYYVQAGYKLTPVLEAILKYDSYDPNKAATGDRTDVTTYGLNLLLNKWSKIQANFESKTEEGAQTKNNTFLTQFQVQY